MVLPRTICVLKKYNGHGCSTNKYNIYTYTYMYQSISSLLQCRNNMFIREFEFKFLIFNERIRVFSRSKSALIVHNY